MNGNTLRDVCFSLPEFFVEKQMQHLLKQPFSFILFFSFQCCFLHCHLPTNPFLWRTRDENGRRGAKETTSWLHQLMKIDFFFFCLLASASPGNNSSGTDSYLDVTSRTYQLSFGIPPLSPIHPLTQPTSIYIVFFSSLLSWRRKIATSWSNMDLTWQRGLSRYEIMKRYWKVFINRSFFSYFFYLLHFLYLMSSCKLWKVVRVGDSRFLM